MCRVRACGRICTTEIMMEDLLALSAKARTDQELCCIASFASLLFCLATLVIVVAALIYTHVDDDATVLDEGFAVALNSLRMPGDAVRRKIEGSVVASMRSGDWSAISGAFSTISDAALLLGNASGIMWQQRNG